MSRLTKKLVQSQAPTTTLAAWPSTHNIDRLTKGSVQFSDFEPQTDTFLEDVLQGLQKLPKDLPSKYLYDSVGSHLFERICTLSEYYPTLYRTYHYARASRRDYRITRRALSAY